MCTVSEGEQASFFVTFDIIQFHTNRKIVAVDHLLSDLSSV